MSKTGNNKLTFLVIFKLTFLVKIILTILTEKYLLKLKYFKSYHTLVNRKKKSPYNQGILKLKCKLVANWWHF